MNFAVFQQLEQHKQLGQHSFEPNQIIHKRLIAMSEPYKVSILVPVYGVEKYIERCARSIFEQTYHNLEIIFVDDCKGESAFLDKRYCR